MHCLFRSNVGDVTNDAVYVLDNEHNAYIGAQNLSQKIADQFHVN